MYFIPYIEVYKMDTFKISIVYFHKIGLEVNIQYGNPCCHFVTVFLLIWCHSNLLGWTYNWWFYFYNILICKCNPVEAFILLGNTGLWVCDIMVCSCDHLSMSLWVIEIFWEVFACLLVFCIFLLHLILMGSFGITWLSVFHMFNCLHESCVEFSPHVNFICCTDFMHF